MDIVVSVFAYQGSVLGSIDTSGRIIFAAQSQPRVSPNSYKWLQDKLQDYLSSVSNVSEHFLSTHSSPPTPSLLIKM